MKTYEELLKELQKIAKMGYVKTHRSGPTGIGKTLEDLLGIEENNISMADGVDIELKSARKNSTSMLTLFTKSPLPKGANAELLHKYGYSADDGKHNRLETTLSALRFNHIKSKAGLKVALTDDKINIVDPNSEEPICYWDRALLKEHFAKKLPKVLYVKADNRGEGKDEEFLFDEAWLLNGLNFDNLVEFLKQDKILIDIRIGQYEDGRTHDHGTGFRIHTDKIPLCFTSREQVI